MKFISIKVRSRTYRVSELDIKKIYVKGNRKIPSLPDFDEEQCKMFSPALTEAEDYSFSELRDEAFLA